MLKRFSKNRCRLHPPPQTMMRLPLRNATAICGDTHSNFTRKDAEQQLVQVHPDFHDIRQDQSFHDWVAIQPQSIQDSLYKNNTDARAAARAIDLYKSDTGKRKTTTKKSAAQAVGRTSSSAPASTGKMKFSESQISKMSDKDFEKHEEAISESLRSGTFSYDLSGAAR
jgi:hypothetical protein